MALFATDFCTYVTEVCDSMGLKPIIPFIVRMFLMTLFVYCCKQINLIVNIFRIGYLFIRFKSDVLWIFLKLDSVKINIFWGFELYRKYLG